MEQKKEKNISLLDLDEFARNEEDLLAFSSKYKTSSYKEEDIKENEIELMDIRKRLSCDSTSISYSQEYSSMSGWNLKKNKEKCLHLCAAILVVQISIYLKTTKI